MNLPPKTAEGNEYWIIDVNMVVLAMLSNSII